MKLKNKQVVIFGLGKSGIASANKLLDEGAKVKITESILQENFDPGLILDLKAKGAELEFNGHTSNFISMPDLVVLSPGVHSDLPILEDLKAKSVPIISEIELAFNFLKKPIIAVTGTNGKTTTTMLIAKLLNDGGKKAMAAGNIGTPLVSIDESKLDFVVAEISSYQLENIIDFKPLISIIINITPDHIERHKNLNNYSLSKANIFKNQDKSDFLIYNSEDKEVLNIIKRSKTKLIPFSTKKRNNNCVFFDKDRLFSLLNNKEIEIIAKDRIKLMGEHNMENVCAAVASAILAGVDQNSIAKTLSSFEGVEHRIELVSSIKGVSFYNDSKATNPDSAVCALKALGKNKNIILIAGGRDKGVDLSIFCKTVKMSAKKVILIGEAKGRFEKELRDIGFDDIKEAATLKEAVKKSFEIAAPGEIVLLSPACASFDMFKNYDDRGKEFKKEVQLLNK